MTKISALTPLGDGLAVGDQFIIRDIDDAGTPNKSVTISGITRGLEVGTALAPSIAFAADKNTGIYGTGSDVLALVTAGENRLHITAGGLVGIGTSSPSNLFHVYGTAGTIASFERTGSNGVFIALKDGSANNVFLGNTNGVFSVQTPGSSFSDKLVITSAGNVGIGTTSVSAWKFHVATSDQYVATFYQSAGSSHGNKDATIAFYDGTYYGNANYWAHTHRWNVNGGGTEAARIDSSGRLLVGTSSARSNLYAAALSAALQVEGTTYNTSALSLIANGSGSAQNPYPICYLGRSRGAAVGSNTVVQSGDEVGAVVFQGADGTNMIPTASIESFVDGTPGANDMPGRLVFSTTADGGSSPTERMRIDSSGYVSINATQNFPGDGNTGTGIFFERAADGGTIFGSRAGGKSGSFNRNEDGEVVRFNRSGVDVGSIDVTTSATSYNTSSDYRLKENIVLLTGATDRLNQLQVHRFNFIADSGATVDGFIAHEAQAVVPECVTGTKDEVDEDGNPVYQGIDQSKLVPLVTAALQEAIAKIETLEARLTAAGIE